jgi:hypothetical protein
MLAAALALCSPASAESFYTKLDLDACTVLSMDEEVGGVELLCPGYGGFDVYVSDFDARMSVDYGVTNDRFETFAAFNSVGETIEWLTDDNGVQATVLRFFIDVDGRKAQALVASKVGYRGEPGCVIGVVDAAMEQANGIARGLAAMSQVFDCTTDRVVIVPGASELVAQFSGASQ